MTFLEVVENLNDTMIDSNVRMMRYNKDTSQEEITKALYDNLELIYQRVLDIIKHYDKNVPTLSKYSKEYRVLIDSWNEFTSEPASPEVLGEKLQIVKMNTLDLINTIKAD